MSHSGGIIRAAARIAILRLGLGSRNGHEKYDMNRGFDFLFSLDDGTN